MTAKRTVFGPIVAMALVSLVSAGLAIGLLYSAAFESERSRLSSMVQHRVRLLENLAGHDALAGHGGTSPGSGVADSSLDRAIAAYRELAVGHAGELTLARRDGSNMVFFLGPCRADGEDCTIPIEGTAAEPMRRALRGETGTVIGPDYRGVTVLAAHAPVGSMGWGAVVKSDLTDVKRPFVIAATLAVLATLLAILISAYGFFRPTSALIDRLRQGEARIRTIVETAAEGIITANAADGRIESFNPAAAAMFGYERDEILGQHLGRIIPDFDPTRCETDNTALSEASTREGTGLRGDGTTFPIELSKTSTTVAGQTLLTVIVRDITERRAADQELRKAHEDLAEMNRRIVEHHVKLIQAEKLSSIGLLAAGVAHEINNPLSGVKACVKALDDNRVPAAQREEYFATARDGLNRIQRIVRNLLNYARERPVTPTTFDAADVVSSSLGLVAPASQKKSLEIVNRIAPGRVINGDRAQVTQALVNVLLNAIHAAPHGSKLELSALSQNGRTGVRITDHGRGIPEEDLVRVRDPFYTTKPVNEGTGLGLAVTDGIVRNHRGELVIDSVEGSGTSVTIWLPAGEEAGA